MSQRGATLIELLIVVLIASVVLLGIGSFYVSMLVSYNTGNAQAFVQRQGTLIQEEMARQILPADAVPGGNCSPGSDKGTNSLRVATNEGNFCFYQNANKIKVCESTALTDTTCKANTERDLLLGSPVPLKANNLSFTTSAGGTFVNMTFELTEALESRIVVDPLKFGMSVKVRN